MKRSPRASSGYLMAAIWRKTPTATAILRRRSAIPTAGRPFTAGQAPAGRTIPKSWWSTFRSRAATLQAIVPDRTASVSRDREGAEPVPAWAPAGPRNADRQGGAMSDISMRFDGLVLGAWLALASLIYVVLAVGFGLGA